MPTLVEQIAAQLDEAKVDAPNWLADPDVELTEDRISELEALGVEFEDDVTPPAGDSGTGDDDDDDDDVITMTREQLLNHNKKYLGRGRRRAHKDAVSKFASEFGLSEEEARAALKNANKDGNKDPVTPTTGTPAGGDALTAEREAIAAQKAEIEAERAEMRNQQVQTKAMAALTEAGVKSPKRAVRLLELTGIDHTSEADEFADAVEELKEEMPELFTVNGGAKQRSGVSGNGRTSPRNPQPQLTPAERGRQRAKENAEARKSELSPLERIKG